MSGVYRKFSKNDLMITSVHARPRVSVWYDPDLGIWQGTTGASASLSLYAGVRGRHDVRREFFASSGISVYPLDPLDTHSIDKVIFVSGSYPSTGSIRIALCSDTPFSTFTQVTPTRWFDEHYRPVELLRDYHETIDSNFFKGNYSANSLLFLNDFTNLAESFPGAYVEFSGALNDRSFSATSSFSVEAWIKPLGSACTRERIIGTTKHNLGLSFGLDTTTGKLTASYHSVDMTSSAGAVVTGDWSHVVYSVTHASSVLTSSIHVNGNLSAQKFTAMIFSSSVDNLDNSLVVGSEWSPRAATSTNGFNGFVFETRMWWDKNLTRSEILANMSGTVMAASSSANLIHYARCNDTLAFKNDTSGFVFPSAITATNHDIFDHSTNAKHGVTHDYTSPISLVVSQVKLAPNDKNLFVHQLNVVNTGSEQILVVHVPSMFYGHQIEPGSVTIVDGAYNSRHVAMTYMDDGRGTLYLSGSMTRALYESSYTGERRRKVGNVFYAEGLVTITDPVVMTSLFTLDPSYSITSPYWNSLSGSFFDFSFKGNNTIYTKVFNCRMGPAQINASNNPTYRYVDDNGTTTTDDDKIKRVREDQTTYITAIGLYNEDRQLVAVAKLAQPIRKREKDKINVRLKIDI